MKIFKLFLLPMMMLFPILLSAQKNFEIKERIATISLGDRTGYSVEIEGMSEKEAEKTLKSWLGEQQKKPTYEETGKHELMVDDIFIPQFGAAAIDLYFLFEEINEDVRVTGFFVVNGSFLSATTNPELYGQGADFMRKFGMRAEKVKVMAILDTAEKELSRKENEQKDLEKKNEQLNSTVKDCEQTIQNAKKDLEENEKDQETKKSEIAKQQTTLEGIQSELKKYEDY